MSLQPGTRLGPYEIVRRLGAGGMGEVYEATDTRLDRRVAVKVLPEIFASDPERRTRFEQEARATAALSHSNIAAVYDVGHDNATHFMVQELVAGMSLRESLSARPDRPLAEWLTLAAEIASALAAAHNAGIVHRDVKPENVMITGDGRAKVLDFGLAKLVETAGANAGDTNSPTTLGTMAGTVMGTVGYLAPEQAAGQPVDRRADIFALGCMLYEMVAGVRPFAGRSAAEIIAHVLHDEPKPLADARPDLPPEFLRIVEKCLRKDPSRRYQRADDLALDLRELAAHPSSPAPSGAARSGSPRRSVIHRMAWPAVVVIVAGAGLWGWLRPLPAVADQPPSRLAIPVPAFGGASTSLQRQIAITPDGGTVLYVGVQNTKHVAMRLDLDQSEAVALPGVREYVGDYSISADGREFVGTIAGNQQMVRYALDGGTARPISADLPASAWTAWGRDGTLWSSVWRNGVFRLAPTGGVEKMTALDSRVQIAQLLPGDRVGLAIRVLSGYFGKLIAIDLATGAETELVNGDVVDARYAAGHLVYVQPDATLQAMPFDPESLRTTGAAVRIADGVTLTGVGTAQFAVAGNGTVVYVPEEQRTLVLVDRDGRSRPATPDRRNYHAPMFSPDGQRIATDFTSADGRDVWVLDLRGGVTSRATFDRDGHDAVWAPDGRSLIYISNSEGSQGIYRARVGAAGRELLLATPQVSYTGLWSDARSILTVSIQPDSPETGLYDLSLVRLGDGKATIEPFLASRFTEDRFAISRDGRWLAFTSNQSGRDEVYVRPMSGGGDQVQVSAAGGIEPVWGADASELFYRSSETAGVPMLMRASITTAPSLAVASRQALFSVADAATATPHRNYDLSPDGRTFAMVRYNPATRIMVIQNLPALVRRLSGATAPAR